MRIKSLQLRELIIKEFQLKINSRTNLLVLNTRLPLIIPCGGKTINIIN